MKNAIPGIFSRKTKALRDKLRQCSKFKLRVITWVDNFICWRIHSPGSAHIINKWPAVHLYRSPVRAAIGHTNCEGRHIKLVRQVRAVGSVPVYKIENGLFQWFECSRSRIFSLEVDR